MCTVKPVQCDKSGINLEIQALSLCLTASDPKFDKAALTAFKIELASKITCKI